MKTRVINIKGLKAEDRGEDFVYIGRRNPLYKLGRSKWANPFKEGVDGDRETVIAKYREWITNGDGRHLLVDLHELRGKTLGCWCKPLACHGDVLAELADSEERL